MRYIYALKKKEEREGTNLKVLDQEIRSVLEKINVKEERYIVINEDSFEFSFSGCIPRGNLQQMGRLLAANRTDMSGFVRQKAWHMRFFRIISHVQKRNGSWLSSQIVQR